MPALETLTSSARRSEKDKKDKNMVFISLSNVMGGAEQMLLMMANTTRSPMIFLRRVKQHYLPLKEEQEVKYLNDKSLLMGFMLLIKALSPYRKGYVIVSSHAYLNAFLGILKRIGYLKSQLVVRESTSLFSRYTGLKKLSYKIAYRLGYPATELIICQTEAMRTELLKSNSYIPGLRALTLPNALDLKAVKAGASKNKSCHRLGREFICTAGRLIPIKGFHILIEAFKEIATAENNLDLLILGEGAERERLSTLIKKYGLQDRVILAGHMDNPYPYFKEAKLCVVSSIREGFPNVLLQMMALNDVIVSTLCAGSIEDIPHITKVKPDDVAALAAGIKHALYAERAATVREDLDNYLAERSPEAFMSAIFKAIA